VSYARKIIKDWLLLAKMESEFLNRLNILLESSGVARGVVFHPPFEKIGINKKNT